MSDNTQGPRQVAAQLAPQAASPCGRLGRRLLVLRVAGLGAAAALPGVAAQAAGPPSPVVPVRTDSDPRDSAGYGRGNSGRSTDNDPRDAAGNGRGAYYNAPQRRSSTDNDPRDAAGNGRGSSAPQRRSVTDSDPSDGQGQGRGWR